MGDEVTGREREASKQPDAKGKAISPILHSASDVLSLRHGPSWMVLAFAAGAVNAGAFLACERFVSHVTGIVSRIGLDAGAWELLLEYGLVLGSFILGAMMSVLAIQGRAFQGKRPHYAFPLIAVATVLAAISFAGHLGVFGHINGQVEETTDFAFLCILAFAMGLMNASVASSTALAVRTTHMTGPATDFGVQLAIAWLTTGEARKTALQIAALRGGKVVFFSLGAVLMVPTMRGLGYLAFVVPAVLVLLATLRSFLPRGDGDVRQTVLTAAL